MLERPDGVSLDDPYVPESVLAALVPGQRVRYDPRNEATQPTHSSSFAAQTNTDFPLAQTLAIGKTGKIISITDSNYEGFPYKVKMDRTYEFARQQWGVVIAAACELVLIEDE